jgi:hypothetical protein
MMPWILFESAPIPGFLTQEESSWSYLEGFEYLTERGVVPSFTVWYPLFDRPIAPKSEYYLKLGESLHKAYSLPRLCRRSSRILRASSLSPRCANEAPSPSALSAAFFASK